MANRLNCKHNRTESHPHREGPKRHTYFKCCDCPAEWTVTEDVADLAEPISSDEVISVHEQLQTDRSLKDLIP